MSTAQLREAAHEAASQCRWLEAASLYEQAVAAYPNTKGALAQLDIERLRSKAESCRAAG